MDMQVLRFYVTFFDPAQPEGSLKVSLSAQTIYTIYFSQKNRTGFPPHTQTMSPQRLPQCSLPPSPERRCFH